MFTTISPSVHYFGSLVALLTTSNPDGSTNITPISSAWSLGDHYVLGLSSHHQGYRNLIRTGEVVLNLPEECMAPAIERISMTTGSDPVPAVKGSSYRTEHDKWAVAGWDPLPGLRTAPPTDCAMSHPYRGDPGQFVALGSRPACNPCARPAGACPR